MTHLIAIVTAFCATQAAVLFASTKVNTEDHIKVIGGRTSGHLDESTENVTIITSKQINSKKYTSH